MASWGEAALDALSSNDAEALISAHRTHSNADINARVADGKYSKSALPHTLQHEPGDTLLHLAMRNQKWYIRKACISDLAADAFLANAAGVTPPGLQMQQSIPRVGIGVGAFGVVWFELISFGTAGYVLAALMLAATVIDALLACRFYLMARHHHLYATRGGQTKKAVRKQAPPSTARSAKKR